MITNQISITSVAPLYPREYVLDTLFGRLGELCPKLPSSQYEEFFCTLFAIKNIEELIDQESFLEFYEMQPALSTQELALLSERVSNFLESKAEVVQSQHKFVVRNVLNTVPKHVDDLVDYITESLLASINFAYMMHLDLPKGEAPEGKLYTSKIMKLSKSERDVSGMLAMEMFQGKKIDDISQLDGITERQRMLTRAAQFWVLSQYGYFTSSLWLAQFIDPLQHCHCTNLDCKGRHFGFADPQGCAELVLAHLSDISQCIEDREKAVNLNKEATVEEIVSSNIELCLSAAESLMFIDQDRERSHEIGLLLSLVISEPDLISTASLIKAILVIDVYKNLYRDNKIGIFASGKFDLASHRLNSIKLLGDYLSDPNANFESERNHFLIHDAYNFFIVHYQVYKNIQEALAFQTRFAMSYYSPECLVKFRDEVKAELEKHSEIIGDPGIGLYKGYLINFLAMLTLKSVMDGPHAREISSTLLSKDDNEEFSNLKFLSEFGTLAGMLRRQNFAESEYQHEYWEKRLSAHPETES